MIRPTLLPASSVNQRLPSTPAAMPKGMLLWVGMGYSVTAPAGVTRPTLLPANSVNQRLPSGPAVIPSGWLLGVGIVDSAETNGLAGSTLTTRLLLAAVNQRL